MERNVSQGAVSRQVKVLEEYLAGAPLRRLHRGVEPTREGRELFEGITLPFQEPGIEIRPSSSTAPVGFEAQNLDAAIRSGCGDWPGPHSERLVDIDPIPLCSPTLMETAKPTRPERPAKARRLHSMARSDDRASWIARENEAPGLLQDNQAAAGAHTLAPGQDEDRVDLGFLQAAVQRPREPLRAAGFDLLRRDAADLGFVQDLLREDLDHHRTAEGGDEGGFPRGGGDRFARHRHVEAGVERLARGLVQRAADEVAGVD